MRFGISAHPSSIHPNSFHPTELHPVENNHPSGSKPGGKEIEKPGSPVVTSGHDPFQPSSSGLPTSSIPMKSTLRDIKLSDDPRNYAIGDTPDENGSYRLYMRDPETDAPKDTGNYVKPVKNGGWKRVGDTDAAKQVANPTLPPAAEIGPGDLGELNENGLFPDGKGNQFGLMGEKHYQMKYDQQLGGYRAVDPHKPNTFQGSVPVKLVGKGRAEPLTNPALKGGMDDGQRPGSSKQSSGQGSKMTPHEVRPTFEVDWRMHDPLGDVDVREVYPTAGAPDPKFNDKWKDSSGIKPGKGWVTTGRHGLEPYTPKPGERPSKEILVDSKDQQGHVKTEWKYYHGSLGSDGSGGSAT
ncbi:hypothetical protein [Dyella sp.]|uniref:hypothetical protein n=1 Tax=Dyella sp. TaxID=1869338 RepID=UPI002FD8B67D